MHTSPLTVAPPAASLYVTIAGTAEAPRQAKHAASAAIADSDELPHHHSNPFLDSPEKHIRAASNMRQAAEEASNSTSPPAAAAAHGNSPYSNPFDDTPLSREEHPTDKQAQPSAARQRQQTLLAVESELPPFTLADLRATTSDLPAVGNQQSSADARAANLDEDLVQTAGFNPFLYGATDHISSTPAEASKLAAVSNGASSEQTEAHPSADHETETAAFNPFLDSATDHVSPTPAEAFEGAAVSNQPNSEQTEAHPSDHETETAAFNPFLDSATDHVSPTPAEPSPGTASPNRHTQAESANAQHSADFANFSTAEPTASTTHATAISSGQAATDHAVSAALSQPDSGDFAEFHSVTAEDDESSSPTAGLSQQHRQHQEEEQQPSEAAAQSVLSERLASTSGRNLSASSNNGEPPFSPGAHVQQHLEASDLTAQRGTQLTSTSSQAEEAHTFADFHDMSLSSGRDSSARDAQASGQSSVEGFTVAAADDEDGFADFDSAPALPTDSLSAEHAASAAAEPTHNSEQRGEDMLPAEPSFQASESAQLQGALAVDESGSSDLDPAEPAVVAESASAIISPQEDALPSEASLEHAVEEVYDVAETSAPVSPSTSSLQDASFTPASLADKLAVDQPADVPNDAALVHASTSAGADALPSQASLDEELADDDFADFADAAAPTVHASTSAAADVLPSQASLDEELADDSFADFADGSAPTAAGPSESPSRAAVHNAEVDSREEQAETIKVAETHQAAGALASICFQRLLHSGNAGSVHFGIHVSTGVYVHMIRKHIADYHGYACNHKTQRCCSDCA